MAFRYKLDHKYRGTALIIGNEFKGQGSHQRAGCQEDVRMMEDVFKKLDFNVTKFMNLTADEMKQKLVKASKDENNKTSDCFVFCLSTHGNEVKISNASSTSAADMWLHGVLGEDQATLFVEEIIEYFTDDNAVGLVGKPKLFFLQACRSRNLEDIYAPSPGDPYDQGVAVNYSSAGDELTEKLKGPDEIESTHWIHAMDLTDAEDIYKDWKKDPDEWHPEIATKSLGSQASEQDAAAGFSEEDGGGGGDSGEMPPSPFDVVPIKCPGDFLIMYPVMSGKYAFRNRRAGSFLFQFLHKGENLTRLLHECNLLQYLTHVCQDMASHEIKPDLDVISHNNHLKEIEAKRDGKCFDRLLTFKSQLNNNIKFLSREENQEMLVKVIGKAHESNLRGDASKVEPLLQGIIETLTEQEMKNILNKILPFKMTACVVHRLKDSVVFKPKRENTPMGKLRNELSVDVIQPQMGIKETAV